MNNRDSPEYLTVLARKHFPGREPDAECLAEAGAIEENYWRRFSEILGKMFGTK